MHENNWLNLPLAPLRRQTLPAGNGSAEAIQLPRPSPSVRCWEEEISPLPCNPARKSTRKLPCLSHRFQRTKNVPAVLLPCPSGGQTRVDHSHPTAAATLNRWVQPRLLCFQAAGNGLGRRSTPPPLDIQRSYSHIHS